MDSVKRFEIFIGLIVNCGTVIFIFAISTMRYVIKMLLYVYCELNISYLNMNLSKFCHFD